MFSKKKTDEVADPEKGNTSNNRDSSNLKAPSPQMIKRHNSFRLQVGNEDSGSMSRRRSVGSQIGNIFSKKETSGEGSNFNTNAITSPGMTRKNMGDSLNQENRLISSMRPGAGLITSREKKGVKFRETVEQVEFRDLNTIMSGSGSTSAADTSSLTSTSAADGLPDGDTAEFKPDMASEDDYDSDESDDQIISAIQEAKLKRDSVNLTERRFSGDNVEPTGKRRDSFMVTALRFSASNRSKTDDETDDEKEADELVPSNAKSIAGQDSLLAVHPSSIRQNSSSSLSVHDVIHKWGSLSSYAGMDKHGHYADVETEEEDKPKPSRRPSFFQMFVKPNEFGELDEENTAENRRTSGATIKSNMVRESAVIKLFDVEKNDFTRTTQQQIATPEDVEQPRESGSMYSKSTVSIGMSKFPHAQEVSETFATRFLAMKFIFLASILNIGLILLAWKMQAPLELPLPPSAVHVTCGVIVELIALITNELTINSLDLGVAIFVSMLMTNKSGYGTSACGLLQMKPINRLTFAQSLSLNSPCRKALERISYVWILLEVTKLLSPIAATGVISGKVRSLADSVSCIVFDANFAKMTDRTYPTMESSGGVAEFLFGNALGCMRSERGDCPADGSQFVFGPQLQGAVGTGDTIVGNGYAMTVATKCKCTETNSKEVINAGVMTTTDQEALSRATKNPFIFLTSTIIATNTSILSYAILGHTQICGGYSKSVMPVCLTNISNFQDAVVSASFETDGTTASIALTNSEIHHILPTKKIGSAAVLKALRTIWPLGKPQSLVSNVPALVNALIYWTSPDLKAIDPTLFPSGIETLYSIILRGGFQRTFNSKGTSCTREISRKDVTSVYFNFQGTIAVYIIGWIQLAASLFALVIGSVWFFSPVPLGPAIKVVTHPMYFISLLCESPFWINLQGTANAQNHVMWQNLDHITRIGESLDTLGEPIGRIKLERPRMVKNLVNGRIYA